MRAIKKLEEVEQELMKDGDTSVMSAIRLVSVAREYLAVIDSPKDLKKAKDIVHTAEQYFRMRKASLIACNELSKERIRIEYLIGQMLIDDEEIHRGGVAGETGRVTLESKYGISRWQAQRYRNLAAIHSEDLRIIFEELDGKEREITSAKVAGLIHEYYGGEDDRKNLHWSVFVGDAVTSLYKAVKSSKGHIKYRISTIKKNLEKIYKEEN